MLDYLIDPVILAPVLAVFGVVSTWLIRRLRWQWAQRVMMAMGTAAKLAVLETARAYTEAIKLGREDGKLTAEEKAEARARAWRTFVALCNQVDLAKALDILGLPGDASTHGTAAIELAHHGLQSLGVIPRSADPRVAQPLTSV